MTVGKRINARLIEVGISQSELARRVGISQSGINSIISGPGSSKHLHRIARELGTTPEYLAGETDDPRRGALPRPTAATIADQVGAIMVPLIDLKGSMGGGELIEEPIVIAHIPFPREFLRARIKGSFDQVAATTGKGDSMAPTINDGDICLYDRAQTDVDVDDLIWFFRREDSANIKRLRGKRAAFSIVSDNPNVRPYDAPAEDVQVFGRVFWVGRWT